MRTLSLLAVSAVLLVATPPYASVPAPTLAELVHSSDRIVRGQIVGSMSVKEEIAINERGDRGRFVFTYITVSPTELLKGDMTTGPVVMRLIGGFWRNRAVFYPDAPNLTLGEDIVVFLRESDRRGRLPAERVFNIVSDHFGKFSVGADDRVSRRATNASLGIDAIDPESHLMAISDLRRAIGAELQREANECRFCDNEEKGGLR